MTAATKVLTAHVPLSLANKVDQMASRLERSRGWIMKQGLSAWIAQEEERDRLTQEALADVAEIDRSHMGKIERGERNVTFLNILKIATAIQWRPSDLLREADL